MAISSTQSKVVYEGDGSTRVWSFNFPVNDASHLKIYTTDEDGKDTVIAAGYEVDLTTNTVKYPVLNMSPIPEGTKITIMRYVPLVQELDLENQGELDAEALEDQFDYLTMAVQQLEERLSRTLSGSVSSGSADSNYSDIYSQILSDLLAQASGSQIDIEAVKAELDQKITDAKAEFLGDEFTAQLLENLSEPVKDVVHSELIDYDFTAIEDAAVSRITAMNIVTKAQMDAVNVELQELTDNTALLQQALAEQDSSLRQISEGLAESIERAAFDYQNFKDDFRDAGFVYTYDEDGNKTGVQLYALEQFRDEQAETLNTLRSEIKEDAESVAISASKSAIKEYVLDKTIDEIASEALDGLSDDVTLLQQQYSELDVKTSGIASDVSDLTVYLKGDEEGGTTGVIQYLNSKITQLPDNISTRIDGLEETISGDGGIEARLATVETGQSVNVDEKIEAALNESVVASKLQLEGDLYDQTLSNLLKISSETLTRKEQDDLQKSLLTTELASGKEELKAYIDEQDNAVALKVTNLASVMKGNYATLQQQIVTTANENAATASSLTSLQAALPNQISAAVESRVSAMATDEFVKASEYETAQAQFKEDIESAVQSEMYAYSDSLKTETLNLKEQVAQYQDSLSEYRNYVTQVSNANAAKAAEFSALQASYDASLAALQEQIDVLADADEASVSSVTTLQAAIDGLDDTTDSRFSQVQDDIKLWVTESEAVGQRIESIASQIASDQYAQVTDDVKTLVTTDESLAQYIQGIAAAQTGGKLAQYEVKTVTDVTESTALADRVQKIGTALNENTYALHSDTISALQNADSSMASDIESLGTRMDSAEAVIQTKADTSVLADYAKASLVTDIQGKADANTAKIRNLENLEVDSDSALMTKLDALQASVDSHDDSIGSLTTNFESKVVTEINKKLSKDSDGNVVMGGTKLASVESVTAAQAQADSVGTASYISDVLNEILENEDGSFDVTAGKIEQIAAQTAIDTLGNETQVYFTDNISNYFTTDPEGLITEAVADRTQELTARVNSNYTTFRSEINALTTLTESQGSDIETLQSAVTVYDENGNPTGTLKASVEETKTTLANLKGDVEATWQLKCDANGKVAGLSLASDGKESSFLVYADKMGVVTAESKNDDGTADYTMPFFIDNNHVYLDNAVIKAESITSDMIAADSITGDKIAANAITTGLLASGITDSLTKADNMSAYYSSDGKTLNMSKVISGIGAGSLSGTVIQDGTIAASKLIANSIDASKIKAKTIVADNIASSTITGAQVATGNSGIGTSNVVSHSISNVAFLRCETEYKSGNFNDRSCVKYIPESTAYDCDCDCDCSNCSDCTYDCDCSWNTYGGYCVSAGFYKWYNFLQAGPVALKCTEVGQQFLIHFVVGFADNESDSYVRLCYSKSSTLSDQADPSGWTQLGMSYHIYFNGIDDNHWPMCFTFSRLFEPTAVGTYYVQPQWYVGDGDSSCRGATYVDSWEITVFHMKR